MWKCEHMITLDGIGYSWGIEHLNLDKLEIFLKSYNCLLIWKEEMSNITNRSQQLSQYLRNTKLLFFAFELTNKAYELYCNNIQNYLSKKIAIPDFLEDLCLTSTNCLLRVKSNFYMISFSYPYTFQYKKCLRS